MLTLLTWAVFAIGIALTILDSLTPVPVEKKPLFIAIVYALLGMSVLGFGLREIASAIRGR